VLKKYKNVDIKFSACGTLLEKLVLTSVVHLLYSNTEA